ncbi:MAG TPA: thiolase family protein [Hyphomicrobiaceae bacterium]
MTAAGSVIVAARRTPIGAFGGRLKTLAAPVMGAAVIGQVIVDAGIDSAEIDEVLMGCVLSAGVGQAPARIAAIQSGLPVGVPCTTINKVCGSGMKTIMLGDDLINAGASLVLAGGMESMSNAPYLLTKARAGYRMGHQEVLDHIFFDGLQNSSDGNMMGHFAETTAAHYGFTRQMQDAFARTSVQRALTAIQSGALEAEIVPLSIQDGTETCEIDQDELPFKCDIEKIPRLRPAFHKDGTITAASSSSIADGAAALLLMSPREADRRGLEPIARIVGHASHAQEPQWFTTAPIEAIRKLLQRVGWRLDDVDLFEINEAFACVTMAVIKDLDLQPEKVNVNGGACAFGHPIGATGSRIMVTMLYAMKQRRLRRGIASLCIGGGEATAIAVECL